MERSENSRVGVRSSPRSAHKFEETTDSEKMDVCDASASFNGNTTSSDINKTLPNDSVILVHSDDEDFAGFGDCKNGNFTSTF